MTLSSYDAFNEWYRKYFGLEMAMTDPGHRQDLWAAWSAAMEWVIDEATTEREEQ
jgi:hypothetical protein